MFVNIWYYQKLRFLFHCCARVKQISSFYPLAFSYFPLTIYLNINAKNKLLYFMTEKNKNIFLLLKLILLFCKNLTTILNGRILFWIKFGIGIWIWFFIRKWIWIRIGSLLGLVEFDRIIISLSWSLSLS